jgi:dynactin complex subunit
VGDAVSVIGQEHIVGRVAYVGEVHYTKGVFCGIVVSGRGGGKNNGTLKGMQYFACPERQGLMVKLEEVKLL